MLRKALSDAGVVFACVTDFDAPHLQWVRQRNRELGIESIVHFFGPDDANSDRRSMIFTKNYAHLNSNPPGFEQFCFLRWFALRARCKAQGWRHVVHLDSDVLFSRDLQFHDVVTEGMPLALCVAANPDFEDIASGHVSVWSADTLDAFCDFIVDAYCSSTFRDDLRRLFDAKYRKRAGGISDMTLLRKFWEMRSKRRNLLLPVNRRACGHNINTGESGDERKYRMAFGLQRIVRTGEHYVAELDNEPVSLWALHFQGRSKFMMRSFASSQSSLDALALRTRHMALTTGKGIRNAISNLR